MVPLNIKSERVRIGLSQEQMASELGVHVNTLRMWESNESVPGSINLMKMVRLFGCSADYLLGFTDERIKKSDERTVAGK